MVKITFIRVASRTDINPGEMKKVRAGVLDILIVNIGGDYYAIDNRCPHANGDLSRGRLSESVIKCPRHGAKFDVTTGRLVAPLRILGEEIQVANLKTYEVRQEGDDILVNIG